MNEQTITQDLFLPDGATEVSQGIEVGDANAIRVGRG